MTDDQEKLDRLLAAIGSKSSAGKSAMEDGAEAAPARRGLPRIRIEVSARLWLERLEPDLASRVKGGDRPFLGLYADLFTEGYRSRIRKFFTGRTKPVELMVDALRAWPAVMASYLTVHVMEGYGGDGTHAVYPYLQSALGGHELSLVEKEQLHRAYRKACSYLGLSVSPRVGGTNYMVDEYLRQAGVPLAYAPELAKRMLRHAALIGTPDDADPVALRIWRQGLQARLTNVSRSVHRALENDTTGYYVRLFGRGCADAGEPREDDGAWETTFLQALAEEPSSRKNAIRHMAVPRLVLRDYQLCVELPAGIDITWIITVDGTARQHSGRAIPYVVPVTDELAQVVVVEQSGSRYGHRFELWRTGKDNETLIFSSDGVLVGAVALGAPEPLELEPGEYQLLLRFVPEGQDDAIDLISQAPRLGLLNVQMQPGRSMVLRRGPAALTLQADVQPWVRFTGTTLRDVRGREVYASTGLRLATVLSPEASEDQEEQFLVVLTCNALGEPIEVPLTELVNGVGELQLDKYLASWRPGLGRLLVELRRSDVRRAQARASVLVWNGLDERLNGSRFRCSRLPDLDQANCDNVVVDAERGLITYRDDAKRFFHVAFGDPQQPTLTWSVPGVFLTLRDYVDSVAREAPILKGTTLAVTPRSRGVLDIRCTEAGRLRLGDYERVVDPKRGTSRSLPLAALRAYLAPGATTLEFIDEAGIAEPLLRLVSPQEVLAFKVEHNADLVQANFETARPAASVRIGAVDVLTGKRLELQVLADDPSAWSDPNCRARLETSKSRALHRQVLSLPTAAWPEGAWVLELQAFVDERWGTLVNQRGDNYGLGVVRLGGVLRMPHVADESVLSVLDQQQDESERIRSLKAVHNGLMSCWAEESWGQLSWLSRVWRRLLRQIDLERPQVLTELVSLAGESASPESAPGWVPMRAILGDAPLVMSMPRSKYSGCKGRKQALPMALGLLSDIDLHLHGLFERGLLANDVILGFRNAAQVVQGGEPFGFEPARYKATLASIDISDHWALLRQEGWRPSEGDYLGRLHYEFCLRSLQDGLERSAEGNDLRRGAALRLATKIKLLSFDELTVVGPPSAVLQRDFHLGLLNPAPEGGRPQEEENLEALLQLIALIAAAARWDARDAGTVDRLFNALRGDLSWAQFQDTISYVLHLGMEALVFYLMLWEIVFLADNDSLFRKGGHVRQ